MDFYKQFNDVTLEKLDIYSRYLQEWLPVPLSGQMAAREAVVYDLFCGPGADDKGQPGSPLRAVDIIRHNSETILRDSNKSVRLVFNDLEADFVDKLQQRLGDTVTGLQGEHLASIDYHRSEFTEIFPRVIAEMKKSGRASLLFIDQFGAMEIDEQRFKDLYSVKHADVLFFITSNWFWRFVERPEAADWLITRTDLESVHYYHIHRFMTEYFRSLVGGDYYLAPFSLKKGSNIYGLIFASHSPRGLEKFLQVAWRKDPHTGEANFDIDREGAQSAQLQMFEPRKKRSFAEELEKRLLRREFDSDRAIYLHMLQSGFLNAHARPVVARLVSEKRIMFVDDAGKRARLRLSYKTINEPRSIVYLDE